MINPYTKENPGNFANDRERASRAGQKSGGKFEAGSERTKDAGHKGGATTSKRYLDEARGQNRR